MSFGGILRCLLSNLILLLVMAWMPAAFAQGNCSAPAFQEYYYSENGAISPSNAPPVIHRVDSDTIGQQAGDPIETQPPGVSFSIGTDGEQVTAMAYDMRSDIFYIAMSPAFDDTGVLFSTKLPLGTAPFEELTTTPGKIFSITIDWTNRNKVYLLTADLVDGSDLRILSFDRVDDPQPGVMPEVVYGPFMNTTPIALAHVTSPIPGDDRLFLAESGFSMDVTLKELAFNAAGMVVDTGNNTNLVEIDDPPSGFYQGYSFDRVTQHLYLSLFDEFLPELVVKEVALTPSVQIFKTFLYSAFDNPPMMGPQCHYFSLGVASSPSFDAELFINCSSFFGMPTAGQVVFERIGNQLTGLATYNVGVPDQGPDVPVGSTMVQCCGPSTDRDTDMDTLADCLDPDPLDPNVPGLPSTPTPSPTPGAGDADGDGIFDEFDACPTMPATQEDLQLEGLEPGCPCSDRNDSDFDGLLNCQESAEDQLIPVGGQCLSTDDFDGDGVQNCFDPCPEDPDKVDPLVCGCGVAETDDCLNECKEGFVDIGCGCGIEDCTNPDGTKVLTNGTKITKPPQVELLGDPNKKKKTVKITLQPFTSGRKVRRDAGRLIARQRANGERPSLAAARKRKTKRLKVSYDIQLKVLKGNRFRQSRRRQSKKAELSFKNLPPGLYSVRYRALTKKRGKAEERSKQKTVTKTKFSPSVSFSL